MAPFVLHITHASGMAPAWRLWHLPGDTQASMRSKFGECGVYWDRRQVGDEWDLSSGSSSRIEVPGRPPEPFQWAGSGSMIRPCNNRYKWFA